MNMLDQVMMMHKKFGITADDVEFTSKEKMFRINAMLEEIGEYAIAETAADQIDALCDLMVFVIGTAVRQGYDGILMDAFSRVMEANIRKELGPNNKRGGFQIDLRKPEGWQAPNFDDLVKKL